MRLQQSDGADLRNVGSRIHQSGQTGPVQSSADNNVVESLRAGEILQQALLLKQENVHNDRASPFRVITPQRQNNILDDVPMPVMPDFSAIRRPSTRAADQVDPQTP